MKAKSKCGFCSQPKIPPGTVPATRGGQPICDDCLDDWNKCFPNPLTQVNNLPKMQAEFAF